LRKLILYFSLVLIISGCELPDFNILPLSVDKMLGEQIQSQIDNNPLQFKVLDEDKYHAAYSEIESIKNNILNSGYVKHKDDFEWSIKIVEDDSILNAFCLPGGYIVVYTGLIKYLDTEDELAGVLGHEIAHADLRHSSNQLLKSYGINLFLKLIFGFDSSFLIDMASNLLDLSFSRSHETAADDKSVEYLSKTNYDPRAISAFFKKISSDQKNPIAMEFLSTHPDPESRIYNIMRKCDDIGVDVGVADYDSYSKFKKLLP